MPTNLIVPPGLVMIGGGLILPFIARSLRPLAFLVFACASLSILWFLPEGTLFSFSLGVYDVILLQVDPLSRVFGTVFAIIALCGGIYAMHVDELHQHVAAMVYAGAALGVTFAGDFLTLFMFWELMAVSSLFLIWARRTLESGGAGMRYLIVHLFGGSLLLTGILLHLSETGNLVVAPIGSHSTVSSWLILSGVALNAAVPPLHAWLTDSYPKASVTGAVFMSAFTTKAAVYVLARVFAGWEVLVFFGVLMTVYGVAFAVLSNDIREILAYHIVSQVGYMVAGVGMGTAMGVNGATSHAFSHILYKALLFMGAGVVLETTGKSKLSELGGLSRVLPVALVLYMVGAFSISGVPLFNGFISKSMVISAAVYDHRTVAVLLFHLASIGTFLSVGLKLPYYTWFGEKKGIVSTKVPVNMYVAMGIVSLLCLMFGVAPSLLYQHLPFPVEYKPYTASHLAEAIQLLTFTFVGFWILRTKLAGEAKIVVDVDWLYRRHGRRAGMYVLTVVERFFDSTEIFMKRFVASIVQWLRNPPAYTEKLLTDFSREKEVDEYDPDRQRLPMETVITLVVLFFLVIAGLSLLT